MPQRLPKAANPFDYRSIADVLFTLEFTAPQDFSYRYLNGPTAETVAAWARAARLAAGLLTGHARRHRTRTRPG